MCRATSTYATERAASFRPVAAPLYPHSLREMVFPLTSYFIQKILFCDASVFPIQQI